MYTHVGKLHAVFLLNVMNKIPCLIKPGSKKLGRNKQQSLVQKAKFEINAGRFNREHYCNPASTSVRGFLSHLSDHAELRENNFLLILIGRINCQFAWRGK